MTSVGQRISAPVSQHVGVGLDVQLGLCRRALDHARESGRRERSAALRHEHKRRCFALPLMCPQCPQFATGQGMGAGRAVLDPANVQVSGLEVHLLPTQIANLGCPQTVAEGQQDHERVAMTVAIVFCRLDQPLDFMLSQMLTRS